MTLAWVVRGRIDQYTGYLVISLTKRGGRIDVATDFLNSWMGVNWIILIRRTGFSQSISEIKNVVGVRNERTFSFLSDG